MCESDLKYLDIFSEIVLSFYNSECLRMSFISALGMIMDSNSRSLRWSVWGPSFLSGEALPPDHPVGWGWSRVWLEPVRSLPLSPSIWAFCGKCPSLLTPVSSELPAQLFLFYIRSLLWHIYSLLFAFELSSSPLTSGRCFLHL